MKVTAAYYYAAQTPLRVCFYPKEISTPYKNIRLLLQTKGCILHLPWWNWASCNVSIYTLLYIVPPIHFFEAYERGTLKHDFVNSSPAVGGCSLFHWDNVEVRFAILGNLQACSFYATKNDRRYPNTKPSTTSTQKWSTLPLHFTEHNKASEHWQ